MNKYKWIVSIGLLMGILGCNDFLKETSQNELRPGSIADLQQLMIGEAYPIGSTFHSYLELMTDNVESCCGTESEYTYKMNGKSVFSWDDNMFEMLGENGVGQIDTYDHYYSCIKGCNVVLEELDDVIGTYEEKAQVRGEALAMRSYYYFMLVNLFGQPYNATDVDIETTPGVPLVLSSKVSDLYPKRVSVATVYRQIEHDLLEAAPLLDKYGQTKSKFRASNLFAYMVLSRLYLYMEDWAKAICYADSVIVRNPVLVNLSDITFQYEDSPGLSTEKVYSLTSPEAIWFYSSGTVLPERYAFYFQAPPYPYGTQAVYQVSESLKECYNRNGFYDLYSTTNKGDLRPAVYYVKYTLVSNPKQVNLWYGMSKGDYTKGLRVSEAYLNRAEGYIRQYLAGNGDKRQQALNDLNFLRSHRFDTRNVPYEELTLGDFPDSETLLQFCLDERRREFAYEDHRWFDLRRCGMPEIKHVFQEDEKQLPVEYTMPKKRYVLPIPQSVLDRNPVLQPNL